MFCFHVVKNVQSTCGVQEKAKAENKIRRCGNTVRRPIIDPLNILITEVSHID